MRDVVLNLTLTLDGFIEGPRGEIDWIVQDESADFGDVLNEILSDKDAIFYGRKSYELWGNYSPDEASQKMKDAYKLLHSKTKYVFSKTKTGDDTNAIFINGDIKERVQEIKQQERKNIWLYGGAGLVTTFLNLDLIDRYQLAIQPVILGKGKPLFQNIEQQHKLKLTDTKPHPSGIVVLTYEADRTKAN